jgi:hypothetical protein
VKSPRLRRGGKGPLEEVARKTVALCGRDASNVPLEGAEIKRVRRPRMASFGSLSRVCSADRPHETRSLPQVPADPHVLDRFREGAPKAHRATREAAKTQVQFAPNGGKDGTNGPEMLSRVMGPVQ